MLHILLELNPYIKELKIGGQVRKYKDKRMQHMLAHRTKPLLYYFKENTNTEVEKISGEVIRY